jgi:acetyltransferase
MTIRNLEYLFHPRSIALIGASNTPASVGAVLMRNLSSAGFKGALWPVNPHHRVLEGLPCYPNIASLPEPPELAVIATPANSVPGLIAALSARGTRTAVVITAGFAELPGAHGKRLQQDMLEAAQPQLLRVVGPNCLGIMAPKSRLNASFSHIAPTAGHLAFVAQSGAIVTSVLDWAIPRGIGFSHLVSLGDMADVDFGDLLDYLANDRDSRAILLYIEAITHARKFMSAARAAARTKPVIVVKAGRHAEGARAAASHTGALAGADAVYDTAFQRAGMLRVLSLEELFEAVETLALAPAPKGNRLTILTNGGGMGVLATDALISQGGHLAELSNDTLEKLNEVLPSTWSHTNPVDIIGDATAARYAKALSILLKDRSADGTLVLNCPTAVASSTEAARAVIDVMVEKSDHTLLTSWVGEQAADEARRLFIEYHIPTYDTPEQAVRAFMQVANYRRNQEMLMETPPSIPQEFSPDTEQACLQIRQALEQGRKWLTEPEAKAVLAAYGIPTVKTFCVSSPREAGKLAAELAAPVVLKILSPDITHKSDVGGVALNLIGAEVVEATASAMIDRVKAAFPNARLSGFTLQRMVYRPNAFELIAGVIEDIQFGPVILVGHGGTAVEIINDKALGLPPLNMRLAHQLIAGTRIHKLLKGYRDVAGADLEAIALTLIRVSQLIIDISEIVELDINPLLADAHGVLALDARIKVQENSQPGTQRLAIRPYPKELEEDVPLGDGRTLLLRPILPEDEPALQAGFAKLTPEEIRLRFFVPLKVLSHMTASRFTQIDYDREMALILTDHGIPGKTEIYGSVRLIADPDNENAEYSIIVRQEMTGMGLGVVLMRRIIDYAHERGLREIHGDVLAENYTMLKLCRVLGFTQTAMPDDPGLVRVKLKL